VLKNIDEPFNDVNNIPAKNQQTLERYVEIQRQMGVPEKS